MRPSFIGHYSEFTDDDNASYPHSTELLSIGSAVGKKLGLKKIGVHIETIPSGRRTSYPHAESEEEEFAFVIEGTPDVWINGDLHPLKPGDFVAFPSGTGITHTFLNNSNIPVKLLVGGEANKETNKIIYPMNDEMNVIKKARDQYWENAPAQVMGPHNGLPDKANNPKWNLPILETDRLILRPIETSDASDIFDYAKDLETTKYVTWEAHQSIANSEKHIKWVHDNYLAGILMYAICLKEDPQTMIGDVSAFWSSRPNKVMELGTILNRKYWGKGIIPEALERLIQHCWETQDIVRIQARCMKENKACYRMMEKVGMRHEGTIHSSLFCKGKAWDMEMFSISK
jgi:uncharacterized cupin superfamily protein/RimJ/RimL family protein N-acetyltransferase